MYLALNVKLGPNRQVPVSLWYMLELAEGSIASRDILAEVSRPGVGSRRSREEQSEEWLVHKSLYCAMNLAEL